MENKLTEYTPKSIKEYLMSIRDRASSALLRDMVEQLYFYVTEYPGDNEDGVTDADRMGQLYNVVYHKMEEDWSFFKHGATFNDSSDQALFDDLYQHLWHIRINGIGRIHDSRSHDRMVRRWVKEHKRVESVDDILSRIRDLSREADMALAEISRLSDVYGFQATFHGKDGRYIENVGHGEFVRTYATIDLVKVEETIDGLKNGKK